MPDDRMDIDNELSSDNDDNSDSKSKIQNLKERGILKYIIISLIVIILILVFISALICGRNCTSDVDRININEGDEVLPHDPYLSFDLEPMRVTIFDSTGNNYSAVVRLSLAMQEGNTDLFNEFIDRKSLIETKVLETIRELAEEAKQSRNITFNMDAIRIRVLKAVNSYIIQCEGEVAEIKCRDREEIFEDIGEDEIQVPAEEFECNCDGFTDEGIVNVLILRYTIMPQR